MFRILSVTPQQQHEQQQQKSDTDHFLALEEEATA